jgi:hypothetical protein
MPEVLARQAFVRRLIVALIDLAGQTEFAGQIDHLRPNDPICSDRRAS